MIHPGLSALTALNVEARFSSTQQAPGLWTFVVPDGRATPVVSFEAYRGGESRVEVKRWDPRTPGAGDEGVAVLTLDALGSPTLVLEDGTSDRYDGISDHWHVIAHGTHWIAASLTYEREGLGVAHVGHACQADVRTVCPGLTIFGCTPAAGRCPALEALSGEPQHPLDHRSPSQARSTSSTGPAAPPKAAHEAPKRRVKGRYRQSGEIMVAHVESQASLHEQLLEAMQDHRRVEHRLARLLAQLDEGRRWRERGHASLGEYARVQLGLEGRKARALAQLGRALRDLPVLDRAMADGELSWTKARELLRVVVPETQASWLEVARESTSRQLEKRVEAASIGEEPPASAPETLRPSRERVVFTMEAAEADLLRDALAHLKSGKADLEDGAVLAAMAQRVLQEAQGDEDAPTGERYRVVLEHCPDCGRTCTDGGAEISEAVASEACCDSEVVELREGPAKGHLSRTIAPALRRVVEHRDRRRCRVPACTNRLHVDIHHIRPFSRGGAHSEQNLVLLCSGHHRLLHDGLLAIEGDANGVLRVGFPDGSVAHVGRPNRCADG